MDNTPIPGAPGFSAPGNLTPEELAEFMRRLRFGGSSLTNSTIDPLGQRTDEGPTPEGQALPQTPEAMNGMLEFAKQAAPSINGSHTANVMKRLGRAEGPAAPTNAAEYEMLKPSDVYDLPSDTASRKQFMDTESAKQAEAKSAADVVESQSRSALHGAQATSLEADSRGNAARLRAIAEIMKAGKDSMDPADLRALGRIAAQDSGVTPEDMAQAKKDEGAAGAATELAGATEREKARKGSLIGKAYDFLSFGKPWPPNEDQQIIARGGTRPDAPGTPAPAGTPGPAQPAGYWNPPPAGSPGDAAAPQITERHMVPDPKDPNIKWFAGRPYRKLPTGGWLLIQQGGFGAGMNPAQ